jgi:23S rRNA (uracil1939-C5)-methyltransferase
VDANPLSAGDVIEVVTERLAYGGDAVARHQGLAIFVPFAAPNETLLVRIVERRKNYARAVIDRILKPSPARRQPACAHFGDCGGCQLQHLDYKTQIEAKAGFILDSLRRVGRIEWSEAVDVVGGPEMGYRSRAKLQVNPGRNLAGFRRARSNEICDVTHCPVMVPQLENAADRVRSALSSPEVNPGLRELWLATDRNGLAVDPDLPGLPGGHLEETVAGKNYRFAPAVFFQANRYLLEPLVAEVTEAESGTFALDLYAGVGLFALPLADRFERVVAVESHRDAARLARHNALVNSANNIELICRDVREVELAPPQPGRIDLIVLDPPRTGAAEAIPLISRSQASRVIYVSCDPVTMARDLRKLLDSGYQMISLKAFDLFPQTYHVECVARLKKA